MQPSYPSQSPHPPLPPPRRSLVNKESVQEESLASLVTSVQRDVARLLDAEKALARQEVEQKLRELKREALVLTAGAVLAGLFLLCLVAAGILALALVLPAAVAALTVAALLGATAAALLFRFKEQIRDFDPVPRETISNVKRDVRAVREALR